jgi:hypothetical protein
MNATVRASSDLAYLPANGKFFLADPLGLAPDLNLFSENDKLRARAEARVDVPGWFVVAGHGMWTHMEGPTKEMLRADVLAERIKAAGYKGGPILLASCNTARRMVDSKGKPIEPLAQSLANVMQAPVRGANDFTYFPAGSNAWGAGPQMNPWNASKSWETFKPSGGK